MAFGSQSRTIMYVSKRTLPLSVYVLEVCAKRRCESRNNRPPISGDAFARLCVEPSMNTTSHHPSSKALDLTQHARYAFFQQIPMSPSPSPAHVSIPIGMSFFGWIIVQSRRQISSMPRATKFCDTWAGRCRSRWRFRKSFG